METAPWSPAVRNQYFSTLGTIYTLSSLKIGVIYRVLWVFLQVSSWTGYSKVGNYERFRIVYRPMWIDQFHEGM